MANIGAFIPSITVETSQKVAENTDFRRRQVLRQNGAHLKNFLNRVKPFIIIFKMSYRFGESVK